MLTLPARPILKTLPIPPKSTEGPIAVAHSRGASVPALHGGANRVEELEKLQLKDEFVASCVKIAEDNEDALAVELKDLLSEARIRQAGAEEQSKLPLPPANEPVFIRRIVVPPDPLRYEEAVDKVVWVKRCLDIIANSIASIPIRVMRRNGGRLGTDTGEPDYESQTAKLLLRLLERPNAHQSGSDIIEAMSIWMNVRQCILWMMWEPNRARTKPEEAAKTAPRALYCLPAHRSVGMMSEGSLYYWRINGAAGPYSSIPAWQTIRIGDYNPKEELRGNSPLGAAFQTADTEYATEIYHANLFEQGLMASGVLSIDAENISKEERERYQAMADQISGVGNAFRIWVIGKKASYQSMMINQKDMDYKNLSIANKKKIAGAMGVPLFMLGEPDAGGKISAAEARKSFWQDRVIPQGKKLVNKLNVQLVPYFGDPDIYLELDCSKIEALAENRSEFSAAFFQASQGIQNMMNQGVMNQVDGANLLRTLFGMEVEGQKPENIYAEEEEIETEDAENEDEIIPADTDELDASAKLDSKIMAVAGRVPAIRQAKNIVVTWILGGRRRSFPDGKIFEAFTRNGVPRDAAGILTERIRFRDFTTAKDAAEYFDGLERRIGEIIPARKVRNERYT